MIGPVVTHTAVASKVYLVGQAPGPREGSFGKPFAWTAGKTLFRWFASIGVDEKTFREKAYMAAVCRCFPGKTKQNSDRVPTPYEIEECGHWMKEEIKILEPELVIPVGRLAIEQLITSAPLVDLIGKKFSKEIFGHTCDFIPLPHPSGASSWYKVEPGKSLLKKALSLINTHPAWKNIKK
jgi:uracil-DNA glycosylase